MTDLEPIYELLDEYNIFYGDREDRLGFNYKEIDFDIVVYDKNKYPQEYLELHITHEPELVRSGFDPRTGKHEHPPEYEQDEKYHKGTPCEILSVLMDYIY